MHDFVCGAWAWLSRWWLCMFVYTYIRIYMGVHVCVGVLGWVLSVYLHLHVCVRLRVAAFKTRPYYPDRLQETRTQSGFVLVVDPIHKRFEDRFMGWSVDQYRFVQWRPDGDSVPKLRHFMWVFILVHFLIYRCRYAFTCCTYHFIWLSIIFYQFDYL